MPRQNTKPADHPQAVLQQIELLAQHIVIARKRRRETQAQWARKLGVSQPTMARIERGDPSVAMASYVMCMWLINPSANLADLIAPLNDHNALEREVKRVQGRGAVVVPALPLPSALPPVLASTLAPAQPATACAEPSPRTVAAATAVAATDHARVAAGLAALIGQPVPPT